MSDTHFDFIVIGGGSAGYSAARTAHALGLRVAVVDGAAELGGLCILRGCMPSKTLIESADRYLTIRHAAEFGLKAQPLGVDVKAIRDRIIRDVRELEAYGVNSIAIMSNDPLDYPDDSFENMTKIAKEYNYPFPYVWDESQEIAKRYGAVCTPDFFGFNDKLELQYRGRLDASRKEAALVDARRDLFEAMVQVAKTGKGPIDQIPSIGCSIKWRTDGNA